MAANCVRLLILRSLLRAVSSKQGGTQVIQLRCKKHPRYKAALPPRASCEACIDIYTIVGKHPRLVFRKEKIELLKPEVPSTDVKAPYAGYDF